MIPTTGRSRYKKTLLDLIQRHVSLDPRNGAEVGVWWGGLSAVLLSEFPRLVLRCVDPWDTMEGDHSTDPFKRGTDRTVKDWDRSQLAGAKRKFLEATEFARRRRMVIQKIGREASDLVRDGSLDFVFIDACHRYESVKEDIANWWPKVRVGGLFSGHDYGTRLDVKGLWGVKRAVEEFCQANGYKSSVGGGFVWWVVR